MKLNLIFLILLMAYPLSGQDMDDTIEIKRTPNEIGGQALFERVIKCH